VRFSPVAFLNSAWLDHVADSLRSHRIDVSRRAFALPPRVMMVEVFVGLSKRSTKMPIDEI